MQPYFFPYLGYFELITHTDKWIVFDVVQYNVKSWMNRNRILHPKQGFQYVTVPVQKAPRGKLIHNIRVKDKDAALSRILGQLDHYKKHAPYFKQVTGLVKKAFDKTTSNRLVDLNVAALAETCAYIGINFDWALCTEMQLDLEGIEHPGQWALEISKQLGAMQYINPPGGKEIFDPLEWEKAGIDLLFTEIPQFRYECKNYEFIEHLSILDVMMWNETEKIRACLVGNTM